VIIRLPHLVAVFAVGWCLAFIAGCGGSGGDAGEESDKPAPPSVQNITCGDTFADESLELEVPEEEVTETIIAVEDAGGSAVDITDDIGTGSLGQEVRAGFRTVLVAGCGSNVTIDNSVTTVTTAVNE